MLPTEIPTVNVYRGDDVVIADVIFQGANSVALDLSGETFAAFWAPSFDSGSRIALAVDDSEANVGHIVVSASSSQTAGLTRRGVWDLQGTASGQVRTWLRGATALMRDVTP